VSGSSLGPLPGSPALVLRPATGPTWLLVADLHLGLGGGAGWMAGPPEGSAPALAERLRQDAERAGAERLLIAGDVKHPVVGVPRGLGPVLFDFFTSLLVDDLDVEVVLGNHDVGLAPHLPKEVVVHPASGAVLPGVGVFHGHRWPSEEVLAQDRLVVGHLHPGFRFAPTADAEASKRRCWVRTTFPPVRPPSRPAGKRARRFRAEELVVLPAYHPLAGTEALNRERPGRGRSFLPARFLAEGQSRLYLLDGTDLGPLRIKGSPPRRPAPPRARRAS
jgi:metallophosphoesterase superfamily enzyme